MVCSPAVKQSCPHISKQLQIRVESDVSPGVYSSGRSGSAPGSVQSWRFWAALQRYPAFTIFKCASQSPFWLLLSTERFYSPACGLQVREPRCSQTSAAASCSTWFGWEGIYPTQKLYVVVVPVFTINALVNPFPACLNFELKVVCCFSVLRLSWLKEDR